MIFQYLHRSNIIRIQIIGSYSIPILHQVGAIDVKMLNGLSFHRDSA